MPLHLTFFILGKVVAQFEISSMNRIKYQAPPIDAVSITPRMSVCNSFRTSEASSVVQLSGIFGQFAFPSTQVGHLNV